MEGRMKERKGRAGEQEREDRGKEGEEDIEIGKKRENYNGRKEDKVILSKKERQESKGNK